MKILLSLVASLVPLFALQAAEKPAKRPNIVVFLVDDMGWMDCGAYGSKYYETPRIDAFAKRAMRFTDAYAQPLCSPTRCSLLTGKYSARHGITSATGHQPPQPQGYRFLPEKAPRNQPLLVPASKNYMEPSEFTLAEALRDAGYRTAHIGKWHLGLTQPHWPEQQGFDVAFHCHPDPGPPGGYFSPYGVKPTGEPRGQNRVGTITDGPQGEYIVDRLADEAVKFITENKDRPFFLNLWNYGVHGPWGHKAEHTKAFADKMDPRGVQGNPIMASMLRSVDECFGRILDALENNDLAENTIVVFNSDNGGNTHSNTAEDAKAQRRKADDGFLADWRKWAGNQPPTINTPLRDGKGTLYEGGCRVPLMWAWPGRIAPGTTSDAVVGHIDLYPTLLDLAGLPRPAQQKMDGISYARVLRGEGGFERRAFFNYFPHGRSPGKAGGVWARSGDWKLIRWFGAANEERFELYNLRDDLSETKNLAAAQPARVKELDALINGFLADTGATFPRPNPAAEATPAPGTWSAGKDAAVEFRDGLAVVASTTGRATLHLLSAPVVNGPLVIKFRMRTTGGRSALVLWGTAEERTFAAARRAEFTASRDGQWHEYGVPISPAGPLASLRIDGSLQPATVEFDWIRVEKPDGSVVKEWTF